MLPLEGIRVIDLTNLLPGPFCTTILADLGAEVIKVERPPTGDPIRLSSPGLFEAVNRNKKSLFLDLKQENAKGVLTKLIKKSDVFIEGFRPGVVARLGFAYKDVKMFNERIIYCSLTGFGQESPYRDIPGHDINYLAVSGVLSISGDPKGPPAAWGGVQVADLCASMYATVSILAALRERDKSGRGSCIDVSMTDCLLAWMGPRIGEYQARGKPSKEKFMGRGAYGAYETKDGKYIAVGCVEDYFWQNLCKALGLEDMAAKEEYATWVNRCERADEINPILKEHFLKKDRDEWLVLMKEADVPCSVVNSIEDLQEDKHNLSRDLVYQVGGCTVIGFPVKFDRIEVRKVARGPNPGEHTEEIFSMLD